MERKPSGEKKSSNTEKKKPRKGEEQSRDKREISYGRELAENSNKTSLYYVNPKSRKNLQAEKKRDKNKN